MAGLGFCQWHVRSGVEAVDSHISSLFQTPGDKANTSCVTEVILEEKARHSFAEEQLHL